MLRQLGQYSLGRFFCTILPVVNGSCKPPNDLELLMERAFSFAHAETLGYDDNGLERYKSIILTNGSVDSVSMSDQYVYVCNEFSVFS